MDKKGLRLAQNCTQRSLATDQKKDVGNGARPWPAAGRGGCNRGGSGSGSSVLPASKSELTRSKPRYQQQRFGGSGFGNKRPQQRGEGGYCQGGSGGNTVATSTGLVSVISDELDAGVEPEYGSVFVQGTKKQNLNHLLNFHYSRNGADQGGNSRNGNNGGGRGSHGRVGKVDNGRWITTEKHKYNKEHYLQANCQFLVKADGDYTKYLNNPDTLVDWDCIEQINIQVNEVPSCPICLYPAMAAKATRCGHIFCWSCILHYLALSDDHWRKCPICYEAVHKQHLKSVVMNPHANFPVNEKITFTLMKRLRGSLTAYPVDHIESSRQMLSSSSPKSISLRVNGSTTTKLPTDIATVPFLHTVSDLVENSSIQCKLVLATSHDVLKIIKRERSDLLLQKMELVSIDVNPELCFVEKAIELLNEREVDVLMKWKGTEDLSTAGGIAEVVIDDKITGAENAVDDDIARSKLQEDVDLSSEFEGGKLEGSVEETSHGNFELAAEARPAELQNGAKTFYFYQASDGQHVYLHAINARMLEHTYGSLKFAPRFISGKILEKETGSITEQLRNRVRYLQHLPLTCQVEVVEIDLSTPIVSEETIDFFRAQLKARQKRRNIRNRSERRREKLIHEHENRQMGRCLVSSPMYSTNLHLDSPNHFPTVKTSVALALAESSSPGNSTTMAFSGARFRLDSERSEGGNRSSRSSSPSTSVLGSSVASCGGEGVGWWTTTRLGGEENGGNAAMASVAGPSFAKMLLESPKPKKSQSSSWPILSDTKVSAKNVIEASDFPSKKTGLSTSRLYRNRNGTSEDSDAESEDYIPAPAYNKSFGDVIAMALEKAAIQNDTKSKNDSGNKSAGGKKKKAKQKVLFATSMSFTGY